MIARSRLLALLSAVLWLAAAAAVAGDRQEAKVRSARWVYEELLLGSDRVVPEPLLRDTRCLAVFPGVTEAALGLGGRHGTGVASCRGADGQWSPPAFLRVSGGSIGLQVGFRKVDLILFFVTEAGARSLGESKFSFGGEASLAAGPVDRRAEVSTDRRFVEDVYLYARAEGLFIGASLEGSRFAAARKATEAYYGQSLWPEQILFQGKVERLPPEAEAFMGGLERLPGPSGAAGENGG